MVEYIWSYRWRIGHFPVRGVMPMVTYSELFQFCLVIVGVISLCILLLAISRCQGDGSLDTLW